LKIVPGFWPPGQNPGTKNVLEEPAGDGAFLPLCTPSSEPIIRAGIRHHPNPKIDQQLAVNGGTCFFAATRDFFFCRFPAAAPGTPALTPTVFAKGGKNMRRQRTLLALGVAMVFIFLTALPAAAAETPLKININTATVDELAQLKRVGPAYAARIVEYREQYGPFEKIEDLMKVRGIGSKTWEENKDNLSVK
jgi:competence protein ComEA